MHITTSAAQGPKDTENVECFFRALPTPATWVGGDRGAAQRCFFPLFSRCVRKTLGQQEPQTQVTLSPSVVLVALCVAFAGADASGVQRLWLFSEDGGSVAPPQRWWRRVIRRTTLMGSSCMWASAFASRHLSFQMKASQPFLQFQRISKLAKESSEKCRLSAAVQVSPRDAQNCIVCIFHDPGTPPPRWPASPLIYENR